MMTLKTMFVLKKDAVVDGIQQNDIIEGGILPKLPYQFTAEEGRSEGNYRCIVDIVMPLGGTHSALFRYPKEGEKVLVGVEGSKSYLMGYLPENPEDQISTGTDDKAVLPDQMAGQFFRYKGPNDDTDDSAAYSEIGFYNEKARWKQNKSDSYPKIDTLKITSAGDVHQKTKNHHQTKAKRFELLVGCQGSKDTDEDSERDYAFGDQQGEDTALYEGDVHIRAKKRIVIKAGKEIVLEVGRSIIVINDKAVKIASRKTRSIIANGWDSVISVNALSGVSAFGQRLTLRSGIEFELSELYGGKIGSSLGITRIQGMDLRLSTLGSNNYLAKGIVNGLDFITNCVTTGMGISGKGGSKYGSFGGQASTMGSRSIGGTIGRKKAGSDLEIYDYKGSANKLIKAVKTINMICSIANAVLEPVASKLKWGFNDEDNKFRDIWMSCWAYVQYGVALAAFTAITTANGKGFIHESALEMAGTSKITLDAMNLEFFGAQAEELKSAIAGLHEKKAEENKKEAAKKAEKESLKEQTKGFHKQGVMDKQTMKDLLKAIKAL